MNGPSYLPNPHNHPIWEELSDALDKAMTRHAPMHSPHEGHSVIREELDELWEHVRADTGRSTDARKEAIQIAAMGLRYALDLCDGCPVRSSITDQPCVLRRGHLRDRDDRFHRYDSRDLRENDQAWAGIYEAEQGLRAALAAQVPAQEEETETCPTCWQLVPVPQLGDHDYGLSLVPAQEERLDVERLARAMDGLSWAWLGWVDGAASDDPRRIEAVRFAATSLADAYRALGVETKEEGAG